MLKSIVIIFIFLLILSVSIMLYLFIPTANIEEGISEAEKIKTTILGAVQEPGTYYIEAKRNLKDLIFLAGGLDENANIKEINFHIIIKPNSEHLIPFNEDRIVKLNLNGIKSEKVLKKIVKTFKLKDKISASIVLHIRTFGKFISWEEVAKIDGVGDKTLTALQKFFFIT